MELNESRSLELKRDLGTWPAISIVVGTVIGSGIFLVPRTMIQHVGTVQAVFVVWVVGGLLSLAGALSYAELAAAIPEAGGEYAYLREAYGPIWGFLYSWTQLWVAKSGSIATLGTGFFLYLTNFFPSMDTVFYSVPLPIGPHGGPLDIRYGQIFAIALILLLAWLNYYGVKLGGNVQVARNRGESGVDRLRYHRRNRLRSSACHERGRNCASDFSRFRCRFGGGALGL